MPKIVSEHEKEQIKSALLEKGAYLIRKKGIKSTTVDDITREAHIGKGSFYSYYNSKEELFWDIIKKEEALIQQRMTTTLSAEGDTKEKIISCLSEEFLNLNSLRIYISNSDFEYLYRKLSPAILAHENIRISTFVRSVLSLCEINESDRDTSVIINLTNLLTFICNSEMSKDRKSQNVTLKIVIHALAEYIANGIL